MADALGEVAELAVAWWSHRTVDSSHLGDAPVMSLWRDGDDLHVRWRSHSSGADAPHVLPRRRRLMYTTPPKSHGIVLPGEPVRVIEREGRLPSHSYVATLHRDGTVEHGAHLPGYHTSPVVIASDGSAVFWRDSALLRISPDGKRIERLLERWVPAASAWWATASSYGLADRAPGRVALAPSSSHDGALRSQFLVVELEL